MKNKCLGCRSYIFSLRTFPPPPPPLHPPPTPTPTGLLSLQFLWHHRIIKFDRVIFLHIVHLTFWCTPGLFSHSPPASFSQFLHSPAPLLRHLRQVKRACGHLHGVKLCYPSGHWRWLGPLTHAVQAAMFHVMWWKQKPFFKTALSQTFPSIFTFMTTWTENPFSLCLRLLWLLFLFCRMVFKLKKRFPCAYLTGGRKWTPCWWGGGGGGG